MNTFLEVKNVTKYYKGEAGSKLLVFENVSFATQNDDNITSILAPEGWGKSTLLKIISGLDFDYEGGILLKGNKVVNKIPFIPEKPSSFPWYDVEGNIKLALKITDNKGSNSKYKLQELIDLTGLSGYEKHFPDNRSYGFRFRIALARAMAVSSELILLDDPLKCMDTETKDEIVQLIKKISGEKGIRFLITTSNITQAYLLSDKENIINFTNLSI